MSDDYNCCEWEQTRDGGWGVEGWRGKQQSGKLTEKQRWKANREIKGEQVIRIVKK